MRNHLIALSDHQSEYLHYLKDYTGMTMNELSRRMHDFCLRPHILNEIIPTYSGSIQLEKD